MDILEIVRTDLKGAGLARQNQVAAACGVPWSTLRKIIDGDTANPRYETVEKLRAYYMSPRERELPRPQQHAAWSGNERRRQMG